MGSGRHSATSPSSSLPSGIIHSSKAPQPPPSFGGRSCGSPPKSKSSAFDVNSLLATSASPSDRLKLKLPTSSPPPPPLSARPFRTPSPNYPSPGISLGPPGPPAPTQSFNPFLLHPNLYQHFLATSGATHAPINPAMLLNAHLALAAQQNMFSVHGNNHHGGPMGPFMDHMRANRFSPYPTTTSPSSVSSLGRTSTDHSKTSGSAFKTIAPRVSNSPDNIQKMSESESTSKGSQEPEDKSSNIAGMEKLVNGLNGGASSGGSQFGISHASDSREISA